MAEQLSEKSHQGFAAQNPPCIGLESDLSRNLCWGCRHVYDETPVDLAVYVRNDPVNLVDPDGRFVTTVVTVEADDPWFWYDRLPNIRSSKTFAMKRIGPGRGIEKSDKDIRSREVTRFKYFCKIFEASISFSFGLAGITILKFDNLFCAEINSVEIINEIKIRNR